MPLSTSEHCIIVGASHGGVTAAFALRKEGWQGSITLIDGDPAIPYHRPPLSKAYLTQIDDALPATLKPLASYEKNNIRLVLGTQVESMSCQHKNVSLENGEVLPFDKLILATGAQPFIPPIIGLNKASNVFSLRNQADVAKIRTAINKSAHKRVVIIGGGYIGLETAASIKKLGAEVTVLEREPRLLARVTSKEMSAFFEQLHTENGVNIKTSQHVKAINKQDNLQTVLCENGEQYLGDIIIIGAGIRVNQTLAEQAGLTIENGITVNSQCQTSNNNIYAIGDCAFHLNEHYHRWLRLESVQNAVDQAKVAALSICNKVTRYDAIPWFWSDQYDVKLQMVGLSEGYTQLVIRQEVDDNKFSVWYFKDEILLSVDAVNHAKAYVIASKLIKSKAVINKHALADNDILLSVDNLTN